MVFEAKLAELGLKLPEPSAPQAMYVPSVLSGNMLFVSGQIPLAEGQLKYIGKAGDQISLEDAQQAARLCAINLLAAVKAHLGDLDLIKRIVKIQVFVASATGFQKQHLVANGASQLLFDVLGEAGRHARTAVGVSELPLNATVEVEAIIEIHTKNE